MPTILFAHQNFPAQFGGFGAFLAERGWDVWFASAEVRGPIPPGCKHIQMTPHRATTDGVHRFVEGHEKAIINAQAFANACLSAKLDRGLTPDIVVAHSGWGSGTFCKAVWPDCKFVAYVEWFYRWPPPDGTPPVEQARATDLRAQAMSRNAPTLLDLAYADLAICPTEFQAAQFPEKFRGDLFVQHDGVDAETLCPNRTLKLNSLENPIPEGSQIITYATRGMEPHRGFPEFMRMLHKLQKERPNLHAVIGGEDRVAYGTKLPEGESWKARMLAELEFDHKRLHFVGPLPRSTYSKLLQASDLHIYFTLPFVLSWSLIEAMSFGCGIVASRNDAVTEVLADGETALLVDHRNEEECLDASRKLLDNRALSLKLGDAARQVILDRYDTRNLWPVREALLRRALRA